MGIPDAHAGCVESDEHVLRTWLRHGQRVNRENVGPAKAVDSGGAHRGRNHGLSTVCHSSRYGGAIAMREKQRNPLRGTYAHNILTV